MNVLFIIDANGHDNKMRKLKCVINFTAFISRLIMYMSDQLDVCAKYIIKSAET